MRILLCGDTPGVTHLIGHVPVENIVGIIAASIRPQYLTELASFAEKVKVPIFIQPKWNSSDYAQFKRQIFDIAPDIIFVNSYTMIIRDDVLSSSTHGGLNVHAAFLPRNRGCNPTQWAIINKEFETGVTLHEIDNGIDTGPIVDQRKVAIYFDDTWAKVRKRELQATNDLLKKNIPKILSGKWDSIPQSNKDATIGRRRKPEDGEFNWAEKIIDIHNKIRALVPPLPSAFYLKEGLKTEFTNYLTPQELLLKKYDPVIGGVQLKSERIKLRPLKKSDSDLLYELIKESDPLIYNASYFPVSESDHEVWIQKMISRRSDLVTFVIELLNEKKVIGICKLFNINWIHRNAELQIRIGDQSYQSKGYGCEAVDLLSYFGHEDLNLHRIYLQVFADNIRVIKDYEKCGFSHEGTCKDSVFIDGEWKDVFSMARLSANG
jgi:methionyl-tRNA formyltransferase